MTKGNEREGVELREAYNEAVLAVKALRDRHVVLVGRYVVVPAGRAAGASIASTKNAAALAEQNLEKGGEQGTKDGDREESEIKGSGGSDLVGFLKGMRDETEDSLLL